MFTTLLLSREMVHLSNTSQKVTRYWLLGLHLSYERMIMMWLLSLQVILILQTAVSVKSFTSITTSTAHESIYQTSNSHNVTTAAITVFELHSARRNNTVENVERIIMEHAIANILANQNAATAMAIMKTGITSATHESLSAAGWKVWMYTVTCKSPVTSAQFEINFQHPRKNSQLWTFWPNMYKPACFW